MRAPARPRRERAAAPLLATERIVIAVIGDAHEAHALVRALVAAAQGGCAVLDADDFTGGLSRETLEPWLAALPPDAWIVACGEPASAALAARFTIGVGRRHEMALRATDLWLGQSSQVVAGALATALCAVSPS